MSTLDSSLLNLMRHSPERTRGDLGNSGWVRHNTLESVIWGFLSIDSFEDALIQVVNLGSDADTAGAVVGAVAGAAYGLSDIPYSWPQHPHGIWPLGSHNTWKTKDFINLSDHLVKIASPLK